MGRRRVSAVMVTRLAGSPATPWCCYHATFLIWFACDTMKMLISRSRTDPASGGQLRSHAAACDAGEYSLSTGGCGGVVVVAQQQQEQQHEDGWGGCGVRPG